VKIYGLISWYQESALWLAAAVTSAAKFCDHIIAVDGAYLLYPEGRARSGAEQSAIIQEVAHANGMGCTIHTPDTVWEGNEVEKRSFLFSLAETVASPNEDWYFVLDADVVLDQVPEDARDRLAATELDAAEVKMFERDDVYTDRKKAQAAMSMEWPINNFTCRCLYRAVPGLTVKGNHYTYVTPDGRKLWSNDGDQVEALNLTDLRCEHRTNFRELVRRNTQRDYYKRRDAARIETDECNRCGEQGNRVLPFDWEEEGDALSARNITVCDACYPDALQRSRDQILALGRDPDGLNYQGPTE